MSLILGVDCSSLTASVALVSDGRLLAQTFINVGLKHSETLMSAISDTLSYGRLSLEQIEQISVTVTPGSFTGLRIGLSTVQGLAISRNIPCRGVSALEAAALNLAHMDTIVCAVMNARAGQLYSATFKAGKGLLKRLTPDRAASAEEIASELGDTPAILTGDCAAMCVEQWDRPSLSLAPEQLRYPTGYTAAIAAPVQDCDSGQLRAEYLRKPQAERDREK